MNRTRHVGLTIWCMLVAAVLILPTLVVVPLSFTDKASFNFPPGGWSLRWYENFWTDEAWVGSLVNSTKIALIASAIATVFGTAAALGLSRWTRRRMSAAMRVVLLASLAVPGIILGVGMYAVFAYFHIIGTTIGFILAHALLGLPLVIVSVTATLSSLDRQFERAAEGLGAGPFTVFRKITLPLIAPGVISGALFAFVFSFDEVMVSLFVKSPFLETLPVKMYASVTDSTDPTIAAAAVMVLTFTTALLGLVLLVLNSRRRNFTRSKS